MFKLTNLRWGWLGWALCFRLVAMERQITSSPHGHILLNSSVWSPDGQWIVYDTRSDPAGEKFDGTRIECVNVATREVRIVHSSTGGAACGVVSYHPTMNRVAFIRGPEDPGKDGWRYGASRRQGVWVDLGNPDAWHRMDARDMAPPFTPGALRGGTHVHVWSPDGRFVSSTYEDEWLARRAGPGVEKNQRGIAVGLCGLPVSVPESHPRNHSGTDFTVLVTTTVDAPRPGSDEIQRAVEESWIGTHGYVDAGGIHRTHSLAFQGQVIFPDGSPGWEVFVVDLPSDLTKAGEGSLCGGERTRARPPNGVRQRRITHSAGRKFPGLQGPRHWLRSSPDGTRIGFLMKDDAGLPQFWTVSPNGGLPRQVTRGDRPVQSVFSWSPDGSRVAMIAGGAVVVAEVDAGRVVEWVSNDKTKPPLRPESCVFSPDGRRIAYVRPVSSNGQFWNQVFMAEAP